MDRQPLVSVQEGRLRGKICFDYEGGQYFSFQGIPYAKPPVGELRFKAPNPPEPWTEIRDATKEGDVCYHRVEFKRKYVGSDDCLFLNVYTPKLPTQSNCDLKPVMFFIHGGSYTYGSGNTDMYGPDYLITQDVVIVTINYRFGILGFLSLEDSSLGAPGNAGLKDQVMALKWVQRNIKQFGGNPDNVTVFGQSSGGASIHYLILSPVAKGLFHKAIIHSATALDFWTRGQSSAALIAKALKLNRIDEKEILRILQNMSVEEVFKVQEALDLLALPSKEGVIGFVIENQSNESTILTEDPLHLLKSGRYNHIPLIIGYASREGLFFATYCKYKYGGFKMHNDFERYIPNTLKLPRDVARSIAEKMKTFYFGGQEPTEEKLDDALVMQTDVNFFHSMSTTVRYLSEKSTAPVYFYRMSLCSSLNIFKNINETIRKHPGACHGDELGYLFKGKLTPKYLGSIEKQGIARFVKLWTNFAKRGNPNSKEEDGLINVTWKPIQRNNLHYLNIGENLTTGVNPEATRMQFWSEIYAISDVNYKL